MKICVYAIAKNEEKFVERWVSSMREADGIYVLDTGSTDRTVEKLADLGVTVHQEVIEPWRFDTARNRSLELVPADADVCVCTDLDEVFQPGWREALEKSWTDGTEQIRYSYIWNVKSDGTPGTSFRYEKAHARHGFQWTHPVHEVLSRTDGERSWKVSECEMVLEHHPDPSKSRGQYLPLLELSVQESPEDDRNAHYLGREYMFYGMWDKAIAQLKRHLNMPTATWEPERCASMRFLSRCCLEKGDKAEAMAWAMRAIAECPETREPWVQAEEAAYSMGDWEAVRYFGRKAVGIQEKPAIYINEDKAWGAYPYDALAFAEYKLGDIDGAIAHTEKALEFGEDDRLRGNLRFYKGVSV